MSFESAFIIYFESDTEPSLIYNSRFLALVPANSSLLLHLLLLLNSSCVRLAHHFTLGICVSLMMLLNRWWHCSTCMHRTTTRWVHWKPTTQSVIRLLPRNPSPAPFQLVSHLLMPLILLLPSDRILELFDILVQELFLRLLLVFRVVTWVSYLLHHGVELFGVLGWLGLQVGENSRLLIHLAWGVRVAEVCLWGWHCLLDVWWKIAYFIPIGACGVISWCASKTALRNQVHWTVNLLCWGRSQNNLSCRVILCSLSFCTCHFVVKFSWWHTQKGWGHLWLWLLSIRYLLRRGCRRCDLVRVSNQISDIFDQIVILLPLPIILW